MMLRILPSSFSPTAASSFSSFSCPSPSPKPSRQRQWNRLGVSTGGRSPVDKDNGNGCACQLGGGASWGRPTHSFVNWDLRVDWEVRVNWELRAYSEICGPPPPAPCSTMPQATHCAGGWTRTSSCATRVSPGGCAYDIRQGIGYVWTTRTTNEDDDADAPQIPGAQRRRRRSWALLGGGSRHSGSRAASAQSTLRNKLYHCHFLSFIFTLISYKVVAG